MYQLRVSRGPHNFCLGLALVKLVKNTLRTWTINTHFYYLAKFTKRFREFQQVQALNNKNISLLKIQHLYGIWSGLTPYRLPLDTLSEYPEP